MPLLDMEPYLAVDRYCPESPHTFHERHGSWAYYLCAPIELRSARTDVARTIPRSCASSGSKRAAARLLLGKRACDRIARPGASGRGNERSSSDRARTGDVRRTTGMQRRYVKWVVRAIALLVVLWVALFAVAGYAMLQPPARFGQIMKRMPQALVWMTLPAPSMWKWARKGTLEEGNVAPDFTLPTQDRSSEVSLSSFRGDKPVVLVFGSYT